VIELAIASGVQGIIRERHPVEKTEEIVGQFRCQLFDAYVQLNSSGYGMRHW
jgi:hypothetical protein